MLLWYGMPVARACDTHLDSSEFSLLNHSFMNVEHPPQEGWRVGVILPDATWKQIWNTVWLCLCLYETCHILLWICWGRWGDPVTAMTVVPYTLCTIFFGVDMVIQSHTAFRNQVVCCIGGPAEGS